MGTNPPKSAAQGDTFEVVYSNEEFPAADWKLTLVIRNSAESKSFQETVEGVHGVKVLTTEIPVGRHEVFCLMEKRTDASYKRTVRWCYITITSAATAQRPKTAAEILLEEIDDAMKKIVSAVDVEIYVNGQSYRKQSIGELQKLRDRTAQRVGEEAALRGEPIRSGRGRKIRTQFVQ